MNEDVTILGIESSCDDTSAAVVRSGVLLSNVIASQAVHEAYGGVVPELASRAHQQNVVPVVDQALRQAGITKHDLTAIAYTRGPGLIGSLLVGIQFAKGLATALDIPIVDVNHLHGHVLAPFIRQDKNDPVPEYPYMCLLVSGGNSQIIVVRNSEDMEIIGRTIDDAAGEAFDKCAKLLGLPYPGGPHIDRLAQQGNPNEFKFAKPNIPGYDYSFSGLKTSFLYTLQRHTSEDPDFISNHLPDLAASLQHTIVDILFSKLEKAWKEIGHPLGVRHLSIGGGVAANSAVRKAAQDFCDRHNITAWIPPRTFTTDNAAMVATAGYMRYIRGIRSELNLPPYARVHV